MFSGQPRWLVVFGLSSGVFVGMGCGGDDPASPGTGGMASGGSSSGAGTVAGSSSSGSTSGGTTSGASGASASAGKSGGGAGGAAGGTGGGGAGGAASGSGGGGAGGGAGGPKAVANITGVNGKTVTGTATFTEDGANVKLAIDLTACTDGKIVSHLHLMKDCGDNAMAAGNHWVPNGEMLGNYTCTAGKATLMVSKPKTTWTIGGDAATDVTLHSFMVHEGEDPSPGMRIGCGVVSKL